MGFHKFIIFDIFLLERRTNVFSVDIGSSSHCLFLTPNKSVCGTAGTLFSKQTYNPVWLPQALTAPGPEGAPLLRGLWHQSAEPHSSPSVCRVHTPRPDTGRTQPKLPHMSLRQKGSCQWGLTLAFPCPQGPVCPLCFYAGHTGVISTKIQSFQKRVAGVPGLVLGADVAFSSQESLAFCASINIKGKGTREPAPSLAWPPACPCSRTGQTPPHRLGREV